MKKYLVKIISPRNVRVKDISKSRLEINGRSHRSVAFLRANVTKIGGPLILFLDINCDDRYYSCVLQFATSLAEAYSRCWAP